MSPGVPANPLLRLRPLWAGIRDPASPRPLRLLQENRRHGASLWPDDPRIALHSALVSENAAKVSNEAAVATATAPGSPARTTRSPWQPVAIKEPLRLDDIERSAGLSTPPGHDGRKTLPAVANLPDADDAVSRTRAAAQRRRRLSALTRWRRWFPAPPQSPSTATATCSRIVSTASTVASYDHPHAAPVQQTVPRQQRICPRDRRPVDAEFATTARTEASRSPAGNAPPATSWRIWSTSCPQIGVPHGVLIEYGTIGDIGAAPASRCNGKP